MSDAIQAVILKRHFLRKTTRAVWFDGLFRIIPNQPHAIYVAGSAPQLVSNFKQQCTRGTTVVGADVGGVAQRVVGIVVTGYYDDPVFCAGILGDDVMHRKFAFGSVGREGIVLD